MIYFNYFSHQHVSVAIAAIFGVKLLQEYKSHLNNFNGNYNNFYLLRIDDNTSNYICTFVFLW